MEGKVKESDRGGEVVLVTELEGKGEEGGDDLPSSSLGKKAKAAGFLVIG